MKKSEFKLGDSIEVCIYGNSISGEYISEDKKTIKMKLINDSSGIFKPGKVMDFDKNWSFCKI